MSDLPPPPASSPPPPPPPSSSLPPAPSGPVDPRSAVTGPAYGLMAVGGVYILYAIFKVILGMLGMGASMLGGGLGGAGRFQMLSSGIGTFIQVVLNLVIAGVVLYGGLQMSKLRNYNVALAASIVAMLPCGLCCCIGLAIGIWSLVVLMKPEVKAAFTG